jgi:acyl-CoA thioesterase-2
MSAQLDELIDLLDLEQIEEHLFRAHHPAGRERRLYGGQIMAQALMAASRTMEGLGEPRPVHSLHGYFLRPGDPRVPAVIKVERLRDGRSFSTRRITVLQNGEAIFNMDASFQVIEPGQEHQIDMPDSSPPSAEKIPDYLYDSAFISWREDFRRLVSSAPQPPRQNVWFKSNGAVPDDPVLQACLLVYESDNALLGTSRLPHRGCYDAEKMQVASLDHAIWFHHPVDVSAWLLYALDAPSSSAGRGLNRGFIFTAEGKLVASTVQEGLIRVR